MVKKWRSIWEGERDRDRRESLPSIRCRLQYDVQYYDGSHIIVLSKGMAYLSLGSHSGQEKIAGAPREEMTC